MVKHLFFNMVCILTILFSLSCVSGQQHADNDFINSKIYPKVSCSEDTSLSYALFLPPQYEKGKPCSVFVLFDSHGDGLLPVNLFSAEAAKSGFILAGSNNSKNGMPVDQTTAIYHNMIQDLKSRFSIEEKAIYLGGFSGGSRVAGAAAITEGGIAGVVGCGAGMPNLNQKPVSKFSYLAVVGNQDFNFTEMQQLDQSLEQAGYQHHLLVFNGIHQWPPMEAVPDIFCWLRFDAMRQNAITPERKEINLFIEKNDKAAGAALVAGKPAEQQEIYTKMMHYLQGLTDVAPLQAEITRLSGDKEVIAYHEKQAQLLLAERELQQKYSPEIQQKGVEWWANETSKLHSLAEKPGNTEMSPVYKRVLGYLSLNCYMYSTGALKQNDLLAASKYIEIYRLVDPTNSEHRYLAAKVAALNHQPDAMFDDLKQALDLGFKDIKRLNSDADFSPYRQDERFKNLVSGR
jgi:hypothetical protein